jgi:selenocysteine lyase/cysteine desulfurase
MKNTHKNRSKVLKGQSEFTLLPKKFIYMNNGTEGSMPASVLKSLNRNLKKWTSNPTTSYETDPVLGKRQQKNRKAMAKFLGVGLNNICLTDNTTMGMSMVMMGLNFKSGDRLVITDHEHPCVSSPGWILKQKVGVEIEVREFPEPFELQQMNSGQLIDFLFPDIPELRDATALIVSHTYNTTGVRLPLDKIRQRADQLNIRYLIVDGAQGLGMLDMNQPENRVDLCDFYVGPTHKWMNGPPGTGVLYINNRNLRPPEFYPPLSQKMGAYMCDDDAGSCLPMAEALTVRGCSMIPANVALTALLKFFKKIGGQQKVARHILELSCIVRNFIAEKAPGSLISPMDAALQSGLVAFYPFDWERPQNYFTGKDEVISVVDRLQQEGVQVRYVPFPTVDLSEGCALHGHHPELVRDCSGEPANQTYAIRVSTGYFNTPQDVRVFKKALKKVLTGLNSRK